MRSTRYVALLRGINVGGRNKVAMADLREAFEDAGFRAVRTYIQSGNVLFDSTAARRSLETDIERMLEARFADPARSSSCARTASCAPSSSAHPTGSARRLTGTTTTSCT